jgi:hypothetical protein
MLGESKLEVLHMVPTQYKPTAILIKVPVDSNTSLEQKADSSLNYPLIFKPDLGERGWMVRKIKSDEESRAYLAQIKADFIVQEFLDMPLEFGVFYIRKPSEEKGKIISINSKEMLTVVGNGRQTLKELVLKNDRAKLQLTRLSKIFYKDWNNVLPDGEILELNSIGNHCLGTKFLNGNSLITSQMNASFDSLSKQIPGFYFGRFDLRCSTIEDLEKGKVKIMELNGCGSEPAHIYQPGSSLWDAYQVLYRHWKIMYEISIENHKRGTPYLSFTDAKKNYLRVRAILGKT